MGGAGTVTIQDPSHSMRAVRLTSGSLGVRQAALPTINHHSGINETDWQESGMDCVRRGCTFFGWPG